MALTRVAPAGIGSTPGIGITIGNSFLHTTGLESTNANFSGIVTAQSFRVTGDFQVDGTTTTLDTVVTSVDKLEVEANNNTVGVAITQSGTGDILNLYDGGTEVFTVKDGGNVGIGTDNTVDQLTLGHTNNQLLGFETDNEPTIQSYNAKLHINTAGNDVVFDGTGNIGIGTDSPGAKLHTYGGNAIMENAGGITLKFQRNDISTSAERLIGAIQFQGNDSNGTYETGAIIRAFSDSSHGTGDKPSRLEFHTTPDNSATPVERLRITADGDLYLNRTSQLTDAKISINADAGEALIAGNTRTNTGTSTVLQTYTSQGNISSNISVDNANRSLILKGANTEGIRITSTGQVSISGAGTTFGVAKLNIAPANRTSAFSASDGDTWHDLVLKQGASATTNSVGIAFEVSPSAYHKNAGTGIAAIKDGNNFDYGTHLAFITRPHTAVAEERLRITSGGNVGIGTDNPADKLSIYSAPNSLILGAKDTSRGNHIFQLLADDAAGNGEIRLYQNSGSGTHTKTVEIASSGSTYFNGGTVGINNSNPSTTYKLDVIGAGIFTTDSNLESNDFNTGQLTVKNNRAAKGAFIDFRAESSNGTSGVIAKIGGFNTYSATGYDGALTFSTRKNTGNTMHERLRIDSDGQVVINRSSGAVLADTSSKLEVFNSTENVILVANSTAAIGQDAGIMFAPANNVYGGKIIVTSEEDFSTGVNRTAHMAFYTRKDGTASERLRITSGGDLLVNHDSSDGSGKLQVFTNSQDGIDILGFSSGAANGGRLTFYRSKSSGVGNFSEVADGDSLGRIDWRGYNDDGTANNLGATIEALVSGAVNSTTDMPSDLVFKTSPDGSASPTERLRITSAGDVGINTTSNNDGAHFQHYQSEVRHQSFQSTNGDLAIVTDNNSNPAVYIKGTGTADLVNIFDNTTEVFTIKDGGNIGIGRDDPSYLLDIRQYTNTSGTNNGTTMMRLQNNVGSGSGILGDITGINGQRTYIDFTFIDANANFTPQVRIGAQVGNPSGSDTGTEAEGSGSFVVYTAKGSGDSGTLTEKLKVTPEGNVKASNSFFCGGSNAAGMFQLAASAGNTVIDTGISVNASNGGGAMMVLACRNTSSGTSTAAGMYLLDFRYDGNHVPGVTFIGGDNFCVFSKSGSNNLTVNCQAGNWSVAAFFGGYGIGNQLNN